MEKDLISVIIPIYNVSKYLDKCIESIINQTYSNLEILLIDDGSTDNCFNICKKWSSLDNRITLFHNSNNGVAYTRNFGLEKATGKYIVFIDSDDYIDKNMIKSLYDNMIKWDVDLSICGTYDDFNGKIINKKLKNKSKKYNIDEAINKIYTTGYYGCGVCNKMFKSQIIKNLKFDENKKNAEEMLLLYNYMRKCKSVYYDSKPLYYYVQRETSITHSKTINIDLINSIKEVIKSEKKYNNKNNEIIINKYALACFQSYNKFVLYGNDIKQEKELFDEIWKYKKIIFVSKNSIFKKIQVILCLYFNKLYKILLIRIKKR